MSRQGPSVRESRSTLTGDRQGYVPDGCFRQEMFIPVGVRYTRQGTVASNKKKIAQAHIAEI